MITVIGGQGSMGKRYCAILRWLQCNYQSQDLKGGCSLADARRSEAWIIASPTDSHFGWCKKAIEHGIPFLCEKPLSKSIDECAELIDLADEHDAEGYVVNNYHYAIRNLKKSSEPKLQYDYYNHGKDHYLWDCCQLLNINGEVKLNFDSPTWEFLVDGCKVPYNTIERSYIEMVDDFVEGESENLWDLNEALDMTIAVHKIGRQAEGDEWCEYS